MLLCVYESKLEAEDRTRSRGKGQTKRDCMDGQFCAGGWLNEKWTKLWTRVRIAFLQAGDYSRFDHSKVTEDGGLGPQSPEYLGPWAGWEKPQLVELVHSSVG